SGAGSRRARIEAQPAAEGKGLLRRRRAIPAERVLAVVIAEAKRKGACADPEELPFEAPADLPRVRGCTERRRVAGGRAPTGPTAGGRGQESRREAGPRAAGARARPAGL